MLKNYYLGLVVGFLCGYFIKFLLTKRIDCPICKSNTKKQYERLGYDESYEEKFK